MCMRNMMRRRGVKDLGPGAGVCGRIHTMWDIMHDTLPFVFPGADEVEVFARF